MGCPDERGRCTPLQTCAPSFDCLFFPPCGVQKPATTPTGKGQETDDASVGDNTMAAHPDEGQQEGKTLAAWVREWMMWAHHY